MSMCVLMEMSAGAERDYLPHYTRVGELVGSGLLVLMLLAAVLVVVWGRFR